MFYLDLAGAVSAGISWDAGQEGQCPQPGRRAVWLQPVWVREEEGEP